MAKIHFSVSILIAGWYSVAVDSLSLSVVAPILCVCWGGGSVVSGPGFVISSFCTV